MRSLKIVREQQSLDNLFAKISQIQRISPDDTDLQAHWARYLCILVSGFLENSISTIHIEYAQKKATPQIVNFVEKRLEKFQNPRMEKVFQLMDSFDKKWGEQLRTRTEGEIKDAVNAIVDSRNSIAHGKSVGISYITIKNYYESSKKLLDILEDILNSNK
ncbi:MAG: hypothetical protein HC916_13775 [Coleofasciculaceae cyanobacterium SM2_1_6]|nr:hypothetical protein [Coleofasciculaceae cyanobacterium SM2_1_6]